MPTQAAVYIRVSTSTQAEEGVSLDAQEATCLRYCAAHGLTVAHLLREEGESAYKLPLADRTEGSRLLGLVASGQVQAVVAYQLSRVFRDDLEAIGYVREWARVGVLLHFPGGSGSVDIGDPFREFMFSLEAGIARHESRRTSQRVKLALTHIASRGGWPGTPPFGYQRGPDCTLEPDPDAAPVVRDLFRRAAKGEPIIALERRLNASGVPCPYWGTLWSRNTVRYVLRNPIYLGRVEWGGGSYAGAHEPLVTRRVWQAVQDRMVVGRVHSGTARSLSPLLRCGECGGPIARTVPEKGRTIYACSTNGRLPAEQRHPGGRVQAPKAEEAIWRQFALDLSPEVLDAAIADLAGRRAHETSRRRGLEKRLAELDEALERTVRLVAQGYPVEVVDKGSAGLVEERAAVLAALEREGAGRGSLEVLRALRGLDVAGLVADAREAPASRQVALLRGLYAEVRVWRDKVEFVPVVGDAVTRELPGYWGAQRGGAWGW